MRIMDTFHLLHIVHILSHYVEEVEVEVMGRDMNSLKEVIRMEMNNLIAGVDGKMDILQSTLRF